MRQSDIIMPLPPALTIEQFCRYAGISRSSADRFIKKNTEAVVRDYPGRKRVLRAWADAFTLGTVHEFHRNESFNRAGVSVASLGRGWMK